MMTRCQSCGMTIEIGPYCPHCVNAEGHLQAFEERLARMIQFIERREGRVGQEEATKRALDAMATLPAWRDHPELIERLRGRG